MANKKLQVILPEFHWRRLKVIENYTGLKPSGIIQRLIEQYKMVGVEPDKTAPPREGGN